MVDLHFGDFIAGKHFNSWVIGKADYTAFEHGIDADKLNATGLVYTGITGTEDASRNGHNLFYGNTITAYNGVYLVGNSSASPNADASGNVGTISLNDTLNYVGFSDPSANQ